MTPVGLPNSIELFKPMHRLLRWIPGGNHSVLKGGMTEQTATHGSRWRFALTLIRVRTHGRLNKVSLATSSTSVGSVDFRAILSGAVTVGLSVDPPMGVSIQEHYVRAIQLGTFLGHHASLVYIQVNLARFLLAEGDLQSAATTLREAQTLIQAGAPGWLRPGLLARQVQYLLASDNLPEAALVLTQSGIEAVIQVEHATYEIHLARVRIILRRRIVAELKEGIQLAARILNLAESGQRNNTFI
jgi:hypothetical protein